MRVTADCDRYKKRDTVTPSKTKRLKPTPYHTYSGTVIFVLVLGLKDMSPETAYSCLVRLHSVVGKSPLTNLLGTSWIGTTATGLFIAIPDESFLRPHDYLSSLYDEVARRGVPIRSGVSWGPFLCFTDIDDRVNFVGRTINIAARLAYSPHNPGCLIHSAYLDYAKGFSSFKDSRVLANRPSVTVLGKKHDGAGFRCCTLTHEDLSVLNSVISKPALKKPSDPPHSAGIVLAYDLPQFSEGDESQIRKRVRSLVDTLRSLKENNLSAKNAEMYFCPGGDGGLLVLTGVRQEALALSKQLAQQLVVESEYKERPISVDARLGVHYGAVTLYVDAAGRVRPTGSSCFIAEDLIADEASRNAGLVFSYALKDVISHGSEAFLRSEFEELPMLTSGPADGVLRYTPRRLVGGEFKHPLIDKLFGPTSSWQSVKFE